VADAKIAQGIARATNTATASLVPLRWARSQKLAGYYDSASHALVYRDARGQEVDRVALPILHGGELTHRVE
jgi:hypothetical protein